MLIDVNHFIEHYKVPTVNEFSKYLRLGVEWVAVEETRGVYNHTYIEALKKIVEMCNEKVYLAHTYNRIGLQGIYVLLDFHQDVCTRSENITETMYQMYGRALCGEGFPDWATIPDLDEAHAFPRPVFTGYKVNDRGIPSEEDCASHFWYYLPPIP